MGLQEGAFTSRKAFFVMLQRCTNKKDLAAGREVHHLIIKSGLELDAFIGSYLIHMFALCGSLLDANNVFCKLHQPDAFSWSAIISAHAKFGLYEKAIKLYHTMQNSFIEPNGHVLVAVLKACTSAEAFMEGKQIHIRVISSGFVSNVFIGNALINMYAKLGGLQHAKSIFDTLPERDVVTWNAMIAGYVQEGYGEETFHFFEKMQEGGFDPNNITYVCLMKACSNRADLNQGQLIHACIVDSGFELDVSIGSILVDMYCKCESVRNAEVVFSQLPKRNEVTWNAMLSGYVLHRHSDKALQQFKQMQQEGIKASQATFLGILNVCSKLSIPDQGKQIHVQIMESDLASKLCMENSLIDMYAKCGSLDDACMVFEYLPYRDVVSYSAMIAACSHAMETSMAFRIFKQMQQEGIQPNQATFASILKACSSLSDIKIMHCHVIENGFEPQLSVGNTLISMYLKCGSLDSMHKVFKRLPIRDSVTWNEMIIAYAQCGNSHEALRLFQQMLQEGLELSRMTSVCILKACSCIAALHEGKILHSYIIVFGYESDVSVGSTLINMYANCGRICEACNTFDRLCHRNVVTWNVMIGGYANHGNLEEALQLLQEMKQAGLEPNCVTFICILKSCARMTDVNRGRVIHALTITCGFESNLLVCNALIDMYAKCESFEDAFKIYDGMHDRDVVTWNTMISGCIRHGQVQMGLKLYQKMQQDGLCPNQVTYVCILKTFLDPLALRHGKLFHFFIGESGLKLNSFLSNTLLNMYAKCGSLEVARRMFDGLSNPDVVAWSAIIAGYAQHGLGDEAFLLFEKMQQEGLKPNKVTCICMLKACSNSASLHQGKMMHSHVMQSGFESDMNVGNALIDMYINCSSLEDSHALFERLPMKDVVTWSSMIGGYANAGNGPYAFRIFEQMQRQGLVPTKATILGILKACSSSTPVLDGGKLLHNQIIESGYEVDINVGSALINMYAKCGTLQNACKVFDKLPEHNAVTWTAIIDGFSQHGDYKAAVQYFERMQQEGCRPDEVTFSCLLSACSYSGLVDKGWVHFKSIRQEHGFSRTIEHCNHMTDILGRAGFLNDAKALLESMPLKLNIVGWSSLLGHCRTHGNAMIARQCFDYVLLEQMVGNSFQERLRWLE